MMFHVMWNDNISETEMLRTAIKELKTRLPQDWSLSLSREARFSTPKASIDGILEVKAPDGTLATIFVEVKRKTLEAREIVYQVRSWRNAVLGLGSSQGNDERVNLMLVAPYLGQSARDELAEEGISFADMTGNTRFVMRRPAVFIETRGANKNPLREHVALKSLRGRGAGRAVRALLDYQPPFGIRELSNATKSSPATISRVIDLLERDAIVSRDSPRGRVLSANWEQLLRRWTRDYSFSEANNMQSYLSPRGIQKTLDKLDKATFKYAITGSFAAARYAPVAQSRLLAVYVEYPEIAEELEIRKAETGGNVLVVIPFDPVVFERTERSDGLVYVRVSQLAADLLTGPGRNPSEGEALLDWMKTNEGRWRIPLTQPT